MKTKPMAVIHDSVDEDFWGEATPRRRINWPGIVGLALLAFSAGAMTAWIYGIVRLLRVY